MSSYLVIIDDGNTAEFGYLANAAVDGIPSSTSDLPSQSVRHGRQAQSSSRDSRLLVFNW